nr:MAG TPA: hypothetical protein [Caudoviricetes sp.]
MYSLNLIILYNILLCLSTLFYKIIKNIFKHKISYILQYYFYSIIYNI